MRYYLIDKVTALQVGTSATGVKCVTLTDEVLHDHFPDHPMLPGASFETERVHIRYPISRGDVYRTCDMSRQ